MNPRLQGGTFATNTGLLTTAGAENVYDTTVAIDYCINGQAYRKATQGDGATPTVDANTGLQFKPVLRNQACVLVWLLDAAGVVHLAQGPAVDVDMQSSVLINSAQFPDVEFERLCPFAYTLFVVGNTAPAAGHVPGTANWNATGLTATTRNVLCMPSNPVKE